MKKVIKGWVIVKKGRTMPYGSSTVDYKIFKLRQKPVVNPEYKVVPVEITLNP